NGLKTLAKELHLPLIVLAQLNRDTERENRVPRLSDLRDSGAIEQDGDIIGLLHRSESAGDVQTVQLIVAKNRTGRTGKVDLIFHPAFTRFESIATPRGTGQTA
ncbi:MAG: DnaB-like helicase C-terminal domain-containing protein, partial [Chloroflexi bacterium]|nr:DnaB-like helicase C-terminal domain-containing protein [Chloroflexota bacterium]